MFVAFREVSSRSGSTCAFCEYGLRSAWVVGWFFICLAFLLPRCVYSILQLPTSLRVLLGALPVLRNSRMFFRTVHPGPKPQTLNPKLKPPKP